MTVNLERRVTAELQNNALVRAQAVAAVIAPDSVDRVDISGSRARELRRLVGEASDTYAARVIVVTGGGRLVVDSDGLGIAGQDYATPQRPEIGSALRGQPTSTIRRSDELGQDLMATAVPIYAEDGSVAGAVRITQDVQGVTDNVRRIRLGLLAIGGAGLVAGLVLAFGLAASLSRPLTRLAAAARRLGSGDLSTRAEDVGGAREVEALARSFDEMAARLERTVLAQREFVANASHQLRTPLTGMKLRLESALESTRDEDLRKQIEAADHEVDRLAEIVDRLLSTSRETEAGGRSMVEVGPAIARAVSRWAERATRAGADLTATGDGGLAIGTDADLDQILDNLLDNAIAYAPGRINVGSARLDEATVITVQDHGPGIPPDELDRVLERFYRGRGAPAGGSGLGLSIARDLAERWGGSLAVSSDPDSGTLVEVRLRPAEPGTQNGAHPID